MYRTDLTIHRVTSSTRCASPCKSSSCCSRSFNAGTVVHGLERGTWAVPVGALVGRPLGTLVAVAASVGLGLRLPNRLGWRDLVVIALAVSSTFTFGLFFATAVFPMGPVLIEAKVGALSTIAGALLATAAAWLLDVGGFDRRERMGTQARAHG